MIKYLFVIVFTLFLATPVLAAKQVNGTIPSVKPLQPMPEDVYVNYKGNVNFEDPSHQGQFDEEGNLNENTDSNASVEQRPLITFEENKVSKTENIISNYKSVIVTIIVIIVLVSSYIFIKSRKVND